MKVLVFLCATLAISGSLLFRVYGRRVRLGVWVGVVWGGPRVPSSMLESLGWREWKQHKLFNSYRIILTMDHASTKWVTVDNTGTLTTPWRIKWACLG